MDWIGRYILDYRPDVVIHLGDHWDCPSLNSYHTAMEKEGQRLRHDISAGNLAFARLNAPLDRYNTRKKRLKEKQYLPEKHFLMGNHERRIERMVWDHPHLEGMIGLHLLDTKGWQVHEFLKILKLDGVWYSHYFYNPKTGKPWGGKCNARLNNVGHTFTMGHSQGKDIAERTIADGTTQRGIVAGSCYLHQENYLGPQGGESWHGVLVKHEVHEGHYDLMEVSLNFLCRKYEQMPLAKFMSEKYGYETR